MTLAALRIPTLAAALALAAAAPAAARGGPDGAGPDGPSGGTEAAVGRPGLTVSPGALINRTLTIRGQVGEGDAGRTVGIERLVLDGSWQPIASAVVGDDGSFRTTWLTDQLGRVTLRAVVGRGDAAAAAGAPLTAQLTVFQPAVASFYGPGFFGRRTACGIRLTRRTLGVAHRTLPCGTPVDLYYRGRTITVPVIDRGPFKPGRDWDLTSAAARQLGVRATVRVGFLPPPPAP